MYTSIDNLPIYNWWKINETNDLKWLCIGHWYFNRIKKSQLKAVWDNIFIEYLDVFGIPKELREISLLRRDYFVNSADYMLTGEPIYKSQMKIAARKLKEITGERKPSKVNMTRVYVQRSLPFQIDDKKMTVREFHEHLRFLEIELDAKLKKQQGNGKR